MICGKVSQRESFRSSAMQAGHTWNVNDEERSFACKCSLPYKRASSARYVVATMRDTGTESSCASISRSITVGTMVLSSFMADCLLPGRKTYPRVVPLPQQFLSSQRSRTPAIHSFGSGGSSRKWTISSVKQMKPLVEGGEAFATHPFSAAEKTDHRRLFVC